MIAVFLMLQPRACYPVTFRLNHGPQHGQVATFTNCDAKYIGPCLLSAPVSAIILLIYARKHDLNEHFM